MQFRFRYDCAEDEPRPRPNHQVLHDQARRNGAGEICCPAGVAPRHGVFVPLLPEHLAGAVVQHERPALPHHEEALPAGKSSDPARNGEGTEVLKPLDCTPNLRKVNKIQKRY